MFFYISKFIINLSLFVHTHTHTHTKHSYCSLLPSPRLVVKHFLAHYQFYILCHYITFINK